jgi:hypothetical protein
MCITPINLKKETWTQKLQDTYHMQQVPCGRCVECLKLRVNSWYIRLMHEKKKSDSALFVTYTYADSDIPYSENGLMEINYKDHQDYVKRLRKHHKGKPIKYFTVGEYGEKTNRPHFHSIIFNTTPEAIEKSWTKGHIHVGTVQDQSVYYTLKYALKRAGKINKSDPWDDRSLEKALMSRGLGQNFLTDNMVKYYKDDPSRPITLPGNKKLPLPRYYRDKVFTTKEKAIRNKLLAPHMEKRVDVISDPLFPQRVQKIYSDIQKKIRETD